VVGRVRGEAVHLPELTRLHELDIHPVA
jgi:hypothetical protein